MTGRNRRVDPGYGVLTTAAYLRYAKPASVVVVGGRIDLALSAGTVGAQERITAQQASPPVASAIHRLDELLPLWSVWRAGIMPAPRHSSSPASQRALAGRRLDLSSTALHESTVAIPRRRGPGRGSL